MSDKCVFCSFCSGRTCSYEKCLVYAALGPVTEQHRVIYGPIWAHFRYDVFVIRGPGGRITRPRSEDEFLANLERLMRQLFIQPPTLEDSEADQSGSDSEEEFIPDFFDLEL